MSRISFSNIQDEETLAKYLKQVLSRPTTDHCLYHYTKFSTFQKIRESNVLRLNRPNLMNDKAEADSIKDNGLDRRMFYTCFSLVPESAEMWKMYTNVNDGCMIKINFELAKKMLGYLVYWDVQGKKYSAQGELSFNSIAYFTEAEDGKKHQYLDCMRSHNNGYSCSLYSEKLAGMIKSNFWRFENEARLVLRTDKDYDDFLELCLDEDFWKECEVVISPFTTNKRIKEIECWCKGRSIKCATSKFTGKLNFENEIIKTKEIREFGVEEFEELFGKEVAGTKSITYSELVLSIVVNKLKDWYSRNSSITEYEEWLQDEMCAILKDFDKDKVRKFVSAIVSYVTT